MIRKSTEEDISDEELEKDVEEDKDALSIVSEDPLDLKKLSISFCSNTLFVFQKTHGKYIFV